MNENTENGRTEKTAGYYIKWGSVALAVVLILSCAASMCSTYNALVRHENGIEASTKDMENVLGAGYKKIQAQGLSVNKYKKIFIEALNVAMTGRYGKTGSQAAFQWIQEKHPKLDPKVFAALQDAIEATFNRFEAVQRDKIDKVRTYKNALREFPNSVWAGMFGFPKIDMKKADQVVSSESAKQDMQKGTLSTPDIGGS